MAYYRRDRLRDRRVCCMTRTSIVLFAIILFFSAVEAQSNATTKIQASSTSANPTQPMPLPADLAAFFSGEWTGAGKFASGKEISADVKFESVLDNQWLLYSHQDRPPNKYKVLGMWGYERGSDKFVMIVEDNFGGSRRFESGGWKDGKVVFVHSVSTAAVSYSERFTFERVAERSFKMSYETNRDGNAWLLGDYLIFTRKS